MTSYHAWTHMPKEQGGTDPIPGVDAGVSWGRGNAEITTSTIDYVEPEFATGTNQTFERTTDGRWSLNGDERLVLAAGNPGTYEIGVNVFDVEGAAGKDTLARILLNFVAPVPSGTWMLPGWFDTASDVSAYEMTFPLMIDSTGTFFSMVASPWTMLLYMNQSDEDLIFRLRCSVEEDASFIATTMNVILSVARIGPATLPVTIA